MIGVIAIMGYTVYKEENGKSAPRPHEDEIAQFIANYFESGVVFLRRYSSKTPDLYIVKIHTGWELKSPIGNEVY